MVDVPMATSLVYFRDELIICPWVDLDRRERTEWYVLVNIAEYGNYVCRHSMPNKKIRPLTVRKCISKFSLWHRRGIGDRVMRGHQDCRSELSLSLLLKSPSAEKKTFETKDSNPVSTDQNNSSSMALYNIQNIQ